MNRWSWLLLIVIGAEGAVGTYLTVRRLTLPRPPMPTFSNFDSYTAGELDAQAKQCRLTVAEDWADLGERYMAHGFFPEAEACYRRAAELGPDKPDILYEWAFCLSLMCRIDEARDQYHRAIEHGYAEPADCWYFLGRDYLRQENAIDARECFRRALPLPAARYEIAKLDVRSGKTQAALPELNRLLSDFPNAFAANLLRARVESDLGNAVAALEFEDRADWSVERLPTPFDAHSKRVSDARNLFGLPQWWFECHTLIEDARYDEAKARLQQGLEYLWQPQGADLLAEVELHNGNVSECERLVEEIIRRDGPTAYRLERLGDVRADQGRTDAAIAAWQRAAALGTVSETANIRGKLMRAYREMDNEELAAQHEAQAYFADGVNAYWNGDFPTADARLSKCVELNPAMPHAWFYLGETRRRANRRTAAQDAYQQCLNIDPNNGRAHDALQLLSAL